MKNRTPTQHPVTSSGKAAPGTDPRIRHRIQIGTFRPIRVDHTNCLQVDIKTHSFIDTVAVAVSGVTLVGGSDMVIVMSVNDVYEPGLMSIDRYRHKT